MSDAIKNNEHFHHSFVPSRHIIRSLKARSDKNRSGTEKIADWLTSHIGSIPFLALNVVWFGVWIPLNVGLIPGIAPFDPYPFGLLTTMVSLEAIILSIFVLMSQNRVTKMYDIREETDLQVDIITEQEITKTIELLLILLEKQGIDVSDDKTLQRMLRPTDTVKIEHSLEKQIE